jgi:hypothetical protein
MMKVLARAVVPRKVAFQVILAFGSNVAPPPCHASIVPFFGVRHIGNRFSQQYIGDMLVRFCRI